jgi:hypothetical protein
MDYWLHGIAAVILLSEYPGNTFQSGIARESRTFSHHNGHVIFSKQLLELATYIIVALITSSPIYIHSIRHAISEINVCRDRMKWKDFPMMDHNCDSVLRTVLHLWCS